MLVPRPEGRGNQGPRSRGGLATGSPSRPDRAQHPDPPAASKGPAPGRGPKRLLIATYDQTLRFNILIVDSLGVAQPYLPATRGLDSPTFVVQRRWSTAGLFPMFSQVFEDLWQAGTQL
jgi:hypothetical protein